MNRRDFLRVGSLLPVGRTLPELLEKRAHANSASTAIYRFCSRAEARAPTGQADTFATPMKRRSPTFDSGCSTASGAPVDRFGDSTGRLNDL